MPTQPLGWFKNPVTKTADLKGVKFRTVGISIDVFTGLGAAVNALPGGEIVSAMDRGLLDAAEFNNATSDRVLGFPDVSKICMLQSYHQNSEQFEIMFNKTKYDGAAGKDEGDHRRRGRYRKRGHVLWGVLVFVNLQAASPSSSPVAMSVFCLKGVSPPHVTRSSPA
jgi:hypothetical protein